MWLCGDRGRIGVGMAIVTVAFAAWNPVALALAAEQRAPNFLWISCEDMSLDMGCYGDAYAKTPYLDQLARDGCRCTNAFVTFPVCAPSRSSIITGMHPGTLGTMHMRTGMKNYQAVPPPEVKCFTEYLRAAGYYCSNHTKTDYQFASPLTAWDALKGDWQNPDRAKDQPFFAVINLTITHESQSWKIEKVAHDPDKVVVPPFYPDTPVVRRTLAKYYDNVAAMDAQAGKILDRLKQDGLTDNTVVFFWADHGRGLPRYKRWPYDTGLHVPLIIRWPGKIKPGSVCDDLTCLIDLAPTVLSIAGGKIPAYMQGRALWGDRKGPAPQYVFGGRNRMDLTSDDFIRTCRDPRYRYLRNFTPEVPYAQEIPYLERMPIMQEWRRMNAEGKLVGPQKLFFQTPKPAEELYDCVEDPYNIHNLAAAPEHRQTLERMRASLEQWIKQIGDLGGVPEDELIERMWPGKKQPLTADPLIRVGKGESDHLTVAITCPTEGASIAYRLDPKGRWLLYHEPLHVKRGAEIQAKASRIGFKPSRAIVQKAEPSTQS